MTGPTRREVRRAQALARQMQAAAAGQDQPADVMIWEQEICACGRHVQFLPGQLANRCAWCGTVVVRAVG